MDISQNHSDYLDSQSPEQAMDWLQKKSLDKFKSKHPGALMTPDDIKDKNQRDKDRRAALKAAGKSPAEIRSSKDAKTDGGLTFDTLPEKVKDAYKRNVTASVAFVKKYGTVRHIAFRRNLKAYVPSSAEKTDAQLNMLQNNNLMQVIDTNAYIKALRELGGNKEEASKKAFRNFKLENVLGFIANNEFFDMRDINKIKERFGEEIYGQLTKNMVNAMNQDVQSSQINEEGDVEEDVISESINKMKRLIDY